MFPKKVQVPEFIEHNGSVPDACLVPMPRWNQKAAVEASEASARSVNNNLTGQLQESIRKLLRLQSELRLFDPMPPWPQHAMVEEFRARTRPVDEKSLLQLQKECSFSVDCEEEVCDLAMPSAPSLELLVDLHDPPTPPSSSSGPQFLHEAPSLPVAMSSLPQQSNSSSAIHVSRNLASKQSMRVSFASEVSVYSLPAACSPSSSRSDCEQMRQDMAEKTPQNAEIQHARSLAAAGHGLSGFTTVMMQHIPFKYTQHELMKEINGDGFEGTYDFLYLPANARSHGSRGFGFINFLSSTLAEKFYRQYLGQNLKHHEARWTITIIPADVQGFEESAARFFSSWMLRKKKYQTKPAFLEPIPAHIAKSQTHGRPN